MCDKAKRSREEGLRRITQAARRNWLWERKYVFENGEAWGRWHRNEGHLQRYLAARPKCKGDVRHQVEVN